MVVFCGTIGALTKKNMPTITIITDCRDENAKSRQTSRVSSLFGRTPSFIGVTSDIEAAGNLIDILDAAGDSDAVVMVNVAPRNGRAKKWKNGTPFGYFMYRNTLVVSTIDGLTLSLIKKLGLVETIEVLDIPTVLDKLITDPDEKKKITETQFRSYEFMPLIAHYLYVHGEITDTKTHSIADIEDIGSVVWWVDSFGNCKTTLLRDEVKETQMNFYDHLRDVPDAETALVLGSSGINSTRFIEIMKQGGSAATVLNLQSGSSVY